MNTRKQIRELDELAGRFITGHKKLTPRDAKILSRIEKLKRDERLLENRRKRIAVLITVMYKEMGK